MNNHNHNQNLEESFTEGAKQDDKIRKYGMPNYSKKKKNKCLFILLIILSMMFFFVIIWGLYILNEKNKTICKLKDHLRKRIYENKELKDNLETTEKELKIILDRNLKIEKVKKNMNEYYKDKIKCLETVNNNLTKNYEDEITCLKLEKENLTKQYEEHINYLEKKNDILIDYLKEAKNSLTDMNEKAKENYDKLLNEMQNIQPEYHYEYKNEVNSDSHDVCAIF